ncbi:MAG: hypothetical protein LBJ17_08725 [Dysgonamonadaceae bacterium]|jgi:hypothetical protein|nr:hypothetical protein [Dysgonamonadaceae bacterium]
MERINKDRISEVLSEKSAKQGLHVKNIAANLVNKFSGELFPDKPPLSFDKVLEKVNRILNTDVKKSDGLFSKVKNPKTGNDRKGLYKLKQKKGDRVERSPIPPNPDPDPNPSEGKEQPVNLYKGKAGECAVMSELLFRGYNVNSMLVDDGVDIVASKNNMFYYLQVKTTSLTDKNKIYATIQQKRFADYMNTQIRYVVVARCNINKVETNLFFLFGNKEIQRLIFDRKINSNQDRIYIKIEIDVKDNLPYIYDEKRECIKFYMNNFDL